MRTLNILSVLLVATVCSGQELPPTCPVCPPPRSDLLPLLVVAVVMFGGGWLIRLLWDRWKAK
ncbi:hypothetical protein ACFLQY_03645 [Verrucomicrobiota bacterium]